jgi:hypothetical protein
MSSRIEREINLFVHFVESAWKQHVMGAQNIEGVTPVDAPLYFRRQYADSISIGVKLDLPEIYFWKRIITATHRIAGDIEHGRGPWDMKPMLLGGANVRVSKRGHRYNVIPLRQRTPGGTKDHHFAAEMPHDIHEAAKRLGKGEALGGTEHAYPAKKKVITHSRRTGKPLFEPITYQHKTGPFEGLMRVGEGEHSRYMTFRGVSERSDPSSWYHPGFKPHHIVSGMQTRFGPMLKEKVLAAAKLDIVDSAQEEATVSLRIVRA